MDLLSPWFLAGSLAAGLPLWLHLMRRSNPDRLPFSSLMFFQKRTETTVRERRLRYKVLLALRIVLLLLLALAFAKPIWERPPAVLATDSPRLHVIVLDTSLSMRYGERWDRATGMAEGLVDSLDDADRALVIANGPSVRVLTEPTADQAALRQALAGLQPTDARNNFGDAIEAVRNLVAEESAAVEVHLISDFQDSAMPTRFQDLVLPDGAELAVHDVSEGEPANWAIESVQGATRIYGKDRPQVEATVTSFAERDAERTVALYLDGRPVGSSTQTVEAGSRARFSFEIVDAPRGFSRAEFRLEPSDSLPIDDSRRATLDNTEPEPVLFVYGDSRRRDLLYYRAALGASEAARFSLEISSPSEAARLDPSRYALVVLSDVPELAAGFESRLRTWVEEGGAALVAVGPNTALAKRVGLTGHAIEQPLAAERGAAPFEIAGEADATHPVADAAEGLRPVKFFLYSRLAPREGDNVPLSLGNGDPLLIDTQLGKGRAILFASALDNVWNDLPLTPVYVPFVAETARYLSGAATARGQAMLGEVLELGRRRGGDGAVQVVAPSGERVLTLSEAVSRDTLTLESLGFYEIRGGRRSGLVAVNPDPRESDLRRIGEDRLELWRSTGGAATAERSPEDGAEPPPPESPPWRVWRLALALLLGTVMLESFVGDRHLDAVRSD